MASSLHPEDEPDFLSASEDPLDPYKIRIYFEYGPRDTTRGAHTLSHVKGKFALDFDHDDTEWDVREKLTLLGFDLDRLPGINGRIRPGSERFLFKSKSLEQGIPLQLPGYDKMPVPQTGTGEIEIARLNQRIRELDQDYKRLRANIVKKIEALHRERTMVIPPSPKYAIEAFEQLDEATEGQIFKDRETMTNLITALDNDLIMGEPYTGNSLKYILATESYNYPPEIKSSIDRVRDAWRRWAREIKDS